MTDPDFSVDPENTGVMQATLPPLREDKPPPAQPFPPWLCFIAFIGLWFAPRTIGRRLVQSSLLVACLVGFTLYTAGVGLILYRTQAIRTGYPIQSFSLPLPETEMRLSEAARLPLTSALEAVHACLAGADPDENAIVLLAAACIPPAAFLLLVPLVAAGEKLGALMSRTAKIVLWSLTLTFPLGLGWLVWEKVLTRITTPTDRSQRHLEQTGIHFEWVNEDAYAIVAHGLWLSWWMLVMIRAGHAYAGPAEGPGWEPRMPWCKKCRYNLNGLSLDSNCPECSTPVRLSLEAIRKKAKFTHWRAFVATIRDAFRDRQ